MILRAFVGYQRLNCGTQHGLVTGCAGANQGDEKVAFGH